MSCKLTFMMVVQGEMHWVWGTLKCTQAVLEDERQDGQATTFHPQTSKIEWANPDPQVQSWTTHYSTHTHISVSFSKKTATTVAEKERRSFLNDWPVVFVLWLTSCTVTVNVCNAFILSCIFTYYIFVGSCHDIWYRDIHDTQKDESCSKKRIK